MSEFESSSIMPSEETTGRYLIFFEPSAYTETANLLLNRAGIKLPKSSELAEEITLSEPWQAQETFVVPELGVAVSKNPPEQIKRLEVDSSSPIRFVRPEYVFHIAANLGKLPPVPDGLLNFTPDYLRGFRAGMNTTIDHLLALQNSLTASNPTLLKEQSVLEEATTASFFKDTDTVTWGLQAIGADMSALTGLDIPIAILDTGFDFEHPDFRDRGIESQSFITGIPTAQDDNGHGTHCLGILCGPMTPSQGRRYGVASNAKVFVGKVMNQNGDGVEGDILNGIGWALRKKCRIISLSLAKSISRNTAPDPAYNEIGATALKSNCLIIAAAGNDSQRPNSIHPVAMPANARTIFAVAAINRKLELFSQSNSGLNVDGGRIDIAAPGVDIYSSERLHNNRIPYGAASGTSTAVPHVAGIAALLMEADKEAKAEQIWARLTQLARQLPLSNADIGGGLAQVP